MTVQDYTLICAIGTPLTAQDELHVEGLEVHVHDQWEGGATGILAGGTMGAMQLLTDEVYSQLLHHAVRFSRGQGQVMAGIGDTSLARTTERARTAAEAKVDAVVVLCPFFIKFSQEQLIDYFVAVADRSRLPTYLYDLPAMTGTALELETVARLSEHPNIVGIKCSREVNFIRRLIEMDLPKFKVIAAQAELVDMFLGHGYRRHLDGVFSLAPAWAREIFRAADAGDWDGAARMQRRFSKLLAILKHYGVFPTFSAILNARGVPGSFAPAPYSPLASDAREQVMREPVVLELIERYSMSPSPVQG